MFKSEKNTSEVKGSEFLEPVQEKCRALLAAARADRVIWNVPSDPELIRTSFVPTKHLCDLRQGKARLLDNNLDY